MCVPPAADWRKVVERVPGVTNTAFVPRPLSDDCTRSEAPCPTDTIPITAATPMVTPRMVRNARSRFAATETSADRIVSAMGTVGLQHPEAGRSSSSPSRSSTMRPSRSLICRRAWAATTGSWVTMTSVRPDSLSSRKIRMTSTPVAVSSEPVGSSARTSAGSVTRARAMATRCCSPPESAFG